MVYLISVYYWLEQDNSLPRLSSGHRAISLVAMVYTLLNHEYLRMAALGLTYGGLIKALKSESYIEEARSYNKETVTPINLPPRAVFVDQNPSAQTAYNVPGVLLLLHHAFINRPKTILLNKYSPKELGARLSHNTVRSASILAGELQPIPDPIVLLPYLSCSNIMWRHWSVLVYDSNRQTDAELNGTCYSMNEVKGQSTMSIQYNPCDVENVHRQSWSKTTLTRKLRQSCYGNLLSEKYFEANEAIPFDPSGEKLLPHYKMMGSIQLSRW